MDRTFADPSHFTVAGAYYPTGHVFAMFDTLDRAQACRDQLSAAAGIGAAQMVTAEAVISAFAEPVESLETMPSVGRERQFMRRYFELAQDGKCALLIDMAQSPNAAAVEDALSAHDALLAYHYRHLVIEELTPPSRKAEAAAAGKL